MLVVDMHRYMLFLYWNPVCDVEDVIKMRFTWMRLPSWSYWAPNFEPVLTLLKTDPAAAMMSGSVGDRSHDRDTWRGWYLSLFTPNFCTQREAIRHVLPHVVFENIACVLSSREAQTCRQHNLRAHFYPAGGAPSSRICCKTRRRRRRRKKSMNK